jgi:hypothetical protein
VWPRDVDGRVHECTDPELLARQPLHRDRLAARAGAPAAPPDLAAHRWQLAVGLAACDVAVGSPGLGLGLGRELVLELRLALHRCLFSA